MAQKRMFDKRVVCSDKFTDLPNSSKALYFMAGMEADDKGFFQPRRIQKMCGFTDDDFKILIAKRFFIPFDSGVMVVTDWNKNNWLDSRRITETEYVDELKMLQLINERYELLDNKIDIKVDVAKPMLSEYSIEENRIEENSIEYKKEKLKKEKVEKKYFESLKVNSLFNEFLELRKKLKAVNTDRAINMLINKLNEYDEETQYEMIEQSIVNSWKGIFELKNKSKKRDNVLDTLREIYNNEKNGNN